MMSECRAQTRTETLWPPKFSRRYRPFRPIRGRMLTTDYQTDRATRVPFRYKCEKIPLIGFDLPHFVEATARPQDTEPGCSRQRRHHKAWNIARSLPQACASGHA